MLILLLKIITLYFIVINMLSLIICCYDKVQARVHGSRVSEKTLLVLSSIGGAPLMYFTMCIIRHKTRKLKFMLGIPFIFAIQILLLIVFLRLM